MCNYNTQYCINMFHQDIYFSFVILDGAFVVLFSDNTDADHTSDTTTGLSLISSHCGH